MRWLPNPFRRHGKIARDPFLVAQLTLPPLLLAMWLPLDALITFAFDEPALLSRVISIGPIGPTLLRLLCALPFVVAPMLLAAQRLRHAGSSPRWAALMPWPLSSLAGLWRSPAAPRVTEAAAEGPYRTNQAPPEPLPPEPLRPGTRWVWVTGLALLSTSAMAWRSANAVLSSGKGPGARIVTAPGGVMCALQQGVRCRQFPDAPLRLMPESRHALDLAVDYRAAYFVSPDGGLWRAPFPGHTMYRLATLDPQNTSLALDETHVYYTSRHKVFQVDKLGGTDTAEVMMYTVEDVSELLVDGGDLWVATDCTLYRLEIATRTIKTRVSHFHGSHLLRAGRWLYWIEAGALRRIAPSSNAPAETVSDGKIVAIAAEAAHLYVWQARPRSLFASDLDGNGRVELARDSRPIAAATADGFGVYWATPDGIHRLPRR